MALPRFLAELKHRNVYRAAVVYAAVGWMLLEAADVVLPRLGLPDWTVNFVLAMVLLGFPLAIVFAWIFDISAQGIVRTPPLSVETHDRFSIPAMVEFVVIVLLVITVGYLYVEKLALQERIINPEVAGAEVSAIPNPEQYRAIAVLPFADMSETGDQVWFAEGIAEELLIALSRIEELKIIARTSSFAFKHTDKTVAEIAEVLGVQAVLEGSVRRSGDRVRIAAQLIDAETGYHIWSGSYERRLTDIFALQDELARGIVQALRVELGVAATEPLVAEQTKSLEAYNWFMRGRAMFDWDSLQSLHDSIGYFEKAVAADPDYAQAWGFLASARSLQFLWRPFNEVEQGVTAAYQQALVLDPRQSEALSAKALWAQFLQYDWETAGKLYQTAMKARDNSVAMTSYAGFYLFAIDRVPQAVQLYADAEQRDPLHAGYKATFSFLLLGSGDVEAAIHKAREALALKPQHMFAIMTLADSYSALGNHAVALELLTSLPVALQQDPRFSTRIARCLAAQGNDAEAREIYAKLIENPDLYHGMLQAVQLALSLGEVEQAIDLMERGVANNAWTQFFIRGRLRDNDTLSNHPRYLALLKRIRLDDESVAELHRKMQFD